MELIDALNLRGWRTAAIIVVTCVGAVVGLFVPRSTPYASQHIVFAGQLTSDNLTPAQIEDFTDELRLAAGLPAVRDAVEDQLGDDFSAEVGGTTSDASIRITATSPNEQVARDASRLTGVEAAQFVIGQSIERNNSLVTALEAELASVTGEQDLVADEAGGINPVAALEVASELLFVAQQDATNGDATAVIQAAALQDEVDELRPLAQRYSRLEQDAIALNTELGQARADSARGQNALSNIDNELFITELTTRQQSAAPRLVQNMLLFAGLNVVALIAVFFLIDRLGKNKPQTAYEPVDDPVLDLTEPQATTATAAADVGPRIEAPPARLTDGAPRTSRERRLSATSSIRSNDTANTDGASADSANSADPEVPESVPAEPQGMQTPTADTGPTNTGSINSGPAKPAAAADTTPANTRPADAAAAEEPAKPSLPAKKKRKASKPTTATTNGTHEKSGQSGSTTQANGGKGSSTNNKDEGRPTSKRVSR